MKDTKKTGPSILLIEEELRPDRQNEICQMVEAGKNGLITVVNHLIDLKEAHERANPTSFRGNSGEEEPDPKWAWSISDAKNFDIVFVHTSNAYASAFLFASSLDPNRVILYSGVPSKRWKRPEGFSEPMSDVELLPLIAELLERWKLSALLPDIFEEIRGERLLREKLFAAGLLCEPLQTQREGTAESLCGGVSALFKVYLVDGNSVDAFLNKALRNVPLRVAVKAVLAPEGRCSELWSLIQHDSKTVVANDDGAKRASSASGEINELLEILCRQKKS